MRPSEVTKNMILERKAKRLSRQEIADDLGISLSSLKRLLSDFDLVNRRSSVPRSSLELNLLEEDERSPEAGRTVIERARMRLGMRMGETKQGYTLDGMYVSVWDILREAGLDGALTTE